MVFEIGLWHIECYCASIYIFNVFKGLKERFVSILSGKDYKR